MTGSFDAGLYTLANDAVLEWFVAFCESVRRHEPDMPLIVIPYDEDVEELVSLSGSYAFEVMEEAHLERLDAIGRELWPDRQDQAPNLRKLATYWGPFERFLLLDADIVVLSRLRPLFDAFADSEADLVYFEEHLDGAYLPGSLRDQMIHSRGAVGFNGGSVMARRGLLKLDDVARLAKDARAIEGQLADALEQPFVNYCADVLGWRKAAAGDLVPEIGGVWAGLRLRRRGGRLVIADGRRNDRGRVVPFLHWAGYQLDPLLPYRREYLRFRLGDASPLVRLRFRLGWWRRFATDPSALRRWASTVPWRALGRLRRLLPIGV